MLPWRMTRDPYRIWLSEIILQQTRISQGLPYYERFIDAYDNIYDLAAAPESEILRHWQGLGYYSRARNMLKCAKIIAGKYGGKFPSSEKELMKLPGIGKYTAAAIASISFDRQVPVIDGNVYRVLSRIFGITEVIQATATKNAFLETANRLIPHEKPGDFNQALMELGALCCIPRNPSCKKCPFSDHCYANLHGKQEELPVVSPKNKSRNRFFHYWVIVLNDRLFLNKREKKDIWLGLYDFPVFESDHENTGFSSHPVVRQLHGNHTLTDTREYRHLHTHQTIQAIFYRWILTVEDTKLLELLPEKGRFYSREETDKLPKPGLIDKYLKEE